MGYGLRFVVYGLWITASPEQGMPAEYREPPERDNRTTQSGADQYVLACNSRRDADSATFSLIERLERDGARITIERNQISSESCRDTTAEPPFSSK